MTNAVAIKGDNTSPQKQAEIIFNSLDLNSGTQSDYKARIKPFISFVEAQGGLNRDVFLDYKRDLASSITLSIATKNKYLTASRVFLKELTRRGQIPDITSGVKSFKQDRKHKRDGFKEGDIMTIAEAIKALPETPINSRLRAIIALLIFQGLRQCEITRLDVNDICGQTAFIRGKGRDDREPIDLHPETIKAISLYVKLNNITSGALFTSNSNKAKGQRLSIRGLRDIVKDFLAEQKIKGNIHGFRHFFTTKLISTYKGDLLEVAGYTRHKSIETLQVYNDRIKRAEDLPRYYSAFKGVSL